MSVRIAPGRTPTQAVTAAILVVSFAVMGFLCCEREHAVEETHEGHDHDHHHHHHVLPDDAPAVSQSAPTMDLDLLPDATPASMPDLPRRTGVRVTRDREILISPVPPFLEHASLLI